MIRFSRIFPVLIIFSLVIFIDCCRPDKKIPAKCKDQVASTNDGDYFRIMCYNTENFFDTFHDSLKNDYEFLPQGRYKWTYDKYKTKIDHISRVIIALGGWNPPVLAGLVEVENDRCLSDLVDKSALATVNYGFIHEESPDVRGIDVALLYLKKRFSPVYHKAIRVKFPGNPAKKTRDILFVKGIINGKDTLNVFVNHWPSRVGGELESEPLRNYIAALLRNVIDSVFTANPQAYVIVMGDFNDEPDNSSIKNILKARIYPDTIIACNLYNISYPLSQKGEGSYKYKGKWGMIDQVIVSGSFLSGNNDLFINRDDFHVFNANFLLEKDRSNVGYKPMRTYLGYRYHGGYSDHLPVYFDVHLK